MDNEQSRDRTYMQSGGFAHPNALQVRLDTSQILESVELFLRGEYMSAGYDKDGNPQIIKSDYGEPLANKKGIQCLMTNFSLVFNPQVVQGNLKFDDYERIVYELHTKLAYLVTLNSPYWGIESQNRTLIVSGLVMISQLFLSRLIDNLERESYKGTIESKEVATLREKSGGFKLFGGGS